MDDRLQSEIRQFAERLLAKEKAKFRGAVTLSGFWALWLAQQNGAITFRIQTA